MLPILLSVDSLDSIFMGFNRDNLSKVVFFISEPTFSSVCSRFQDSKSIGLFFSTTCFSLKLHLNNDITKSETFLIFYQLLYVLDRQEGFLIIPHDKVRQLLNQYLSSSCTKIKARFSPYNTANFNYLCDYTAQFQ